jgi:hypothetical protein
MRLRLTADDILLLVAVIALLYFRSWWSSLLFLAVLAYIVYRYIQVKKKEPPADANEFLIDRDDISYASAELDVDLLYRPTPSHFRINEHFDTRYTDSEYEFRIEGTKVFARLIALKTMDIGEKKHYEVRDGVVLEADIRQMAEGQPPFVKKSTEERIENFKKDTEWHELSTSKWGGLKYFIISKKLPQPDARRYLRQELERLQSGSAAFFKEGDNLGLERDDDSKFVDRLRVAEGKPRPSDKEIQKLFEKMEGFGITQLEFSWGKKLCDVLGKLLGD